MCNISVLKFYIINFRDKKEEIDIEVSNMKKEAVKRELKNLDNKKRQDDELHKLRCQTEILAQQFLTQKIELIKSSMVWVFIDLFSYKFDEVTCNRFLAKHLTKCKLLISSRKLSSTSFSFMIS